MTAVIRTNSPGTKIETELIDGNSSDFFGDQPPEGGIDILDNEDDGLYLAVLVAEWKGLATGVYKLEPIPTSTEEAADEYFEEE